LTTLTCHQGCIWMSSGSPGSKSLATDLLTRHSSFLALHLFMMAMYSLRPTPTNLTMSAACKSQKVSQRRTGNQEAGGGV